MEVGGWAGSGQKKTGAAKAREVVLGVVSGVLKVDGAEKELARFGGLQGGCGRCRWWLKEAQGGENELDRSSSRTGDGRLKNRGGWPRVFEALTDNDRLPKDDQGVKGSHLGVVVCGRDIELGQVRDKPKPALKRGIMVLRTARWALGGANDGRRVLRGRRGVGEVAVGDRGWSHRLAGLKMPTEP